MARNTGTGLMNAIISSWLSASHFLEQGNQFRGLFDLVSLVSGGDGLIDAGPGVNVEDSHPGSTQCRLHGGELLENVHAISLIFHHPDDAARLTFDPAHPGNFAGEFFGHQCSHASFWKSSQYFRVSSSS